MKYSVELKKVNKVFEMGDGLNFQALKNINLKIKKGEFVAIVGPSGSGKSTLMNLFGLLDSPTSGIYILDGRTTSGLSDKNKALARNKKIGFVFQSFNLLSRTSALQNVMLPLVYSRVSLEERIRRAKEILADVGLADKYESKPNQLSGGQQQRVAIARALVIDPEIILADEPTGNLDTKTGEEIFSIFEKLNKKGKTVVLITHSDELAKKAKRMIRIKDGGIVGGIS
ncbi:MAG: ABC transporter ATP-binding protein [Patescibacteria group bacterium]